MSNAVVGSPENREKSGAEEQEELDRDEKLANHVKETMTGCGFFNSKWTASIDDKGSKLALHNSE